MATIDDFLKLDIGGIPEKGDVVLLKPDITVPNGISIG